MKIKSLILTLLLVSWAIPSYAITAEATYNQLAKVAAMINNPNATADSLEKVLQQAADAVGEYTRTSAKTTPLGRTDPLVPEFRQAGVGLSIISLTVMNGGNVTQARRDAKEVMDELRARMK